MDTNAKAAVAGDHDRSHDDARLPKSGQGLARRPEQGNPVVIGRVDKNSRERIRVALDAYNGRTYLDCRVVIQNQDGSDKPTKAGITIRPDRIADLRRLIEDAEAEAQRLGLIGGPL